jgi:hypothetical protein
MVVYNIYFISYFKYTVYNMMFEIWMFIIFVLYFFCNSPLNLNYLAYKKVKCMRLPCSMCPRSFNF